VYILLRAAYWEEAIRFWHVLGTLIVWILQYIAYQGILVSSGETATTTCNNNSTDLAGGVFLDLLGLTIVVQFGTALWSTKVYWLLAIVPPMGLWKLYNSFQSMYSMPGAATTPAEETSDEKTDKRRKRSERRRQKWS
jgi:hypothetical protein